ncbi:MAG: toll/interleukin-1 receptor domain-containing protein [Bacteroidales bacterium]|nr:toll/interleukin-1 receptor domain-containing protein [Bacteroidales bacterium]
MERILITYSHNGKETANKIQETLRKAGFKSSVGAIRLDENGATPEMVVAVITNDSCDDPEIADLLRQCEQQNINVVPFVAETLPKNLLTDFFLDEHVWIDGASQPMNTALGDLGDLFKRNYRELSKPATKKKDEYGKRQTAAAATATAKNAPQKSKQPSEKEKLYKNLFFISLAVIVVMLFILINGGTKQVNREASIQQANYQNALGNSNIKIELSSELKKSETALVGHWKMTDYSDNQYRSTHEDSLNLQNLINGLVSRVSLTFNADKTFSRTGYTETPEHGTWEYDPQSKYLKLKPTTVNQYDIVQIQDLTPTKLIIVVTEKVENNSIITKLIFTKVN